MTFRIYLKSPKKNKFVRNKFNLEKLKDPETGKLFKHNIDKKLSEQNVTNIPDT